MLGICFPYEKRSGYKEDVKGSASISMIVFQLSITVSTFRSCFAVVIIELWAFAKDMVLSSVVLYVSNWFGLVQSPTTLFERNIEFSETPL